MDIFSYNERDNLFIKEMLGDELYEKIETIELFYIEELNTLRLEVLVIKRKYRCKGFGSKILNKVVELARKDGFCVSLSPSEAYGTDIQTLHKFYTKNGGVLDERGNNFFFS